MPLLEYVCRECGGACELLIRGKEKPVCPSCGSDNLDKQISAPAAPQIISKSTCPAQGSRSCGVSDCGSCPCAMSD